MPEELEFYIPVDENQDSVYKLELLFNDRGFPSTFSIYQCLEKRKKVKSGEEVVWFLKTFAYCFEYRTGNLQYHSSHLGDFTKPDFRWSDPGREEFEEEEITSKHRMDARNAARSVYMEVKYDKENASTLREREKYDRFLSPLDKILADEGK